MFHPNAVNESNGLEQGHNFEEAKALIEYLNTDMEAVLPSKLAKTICELSALLCFLLIFRGVDMGVDMPKKHK